MNVCANNLDFIRVITYFKLCKKYTGFYKRRFRQEDLLEDQGISLLDRFVLKTSWKTREIVFLTDLSRKPPSL